MTLSLQDLLHCPPQKAIHVDVAGREPNAGTWPMPFFLCESPGSNKKALFSFMSSPWVFLKPHLANLSLTISHFSVKSRIVQTGQDSLQLSHSSQSTQELAQGQALHHLQPARNTSVPSINCSLPQGLSTTMCYQLSQWKGNLPPLISPGNRLSYVQVLQQAECYKDYKSCRYTLTNSAVLQADVFSVLAYQSYQIPTWVSETAFTYNAKCFFPTLQLSYGNS